MATRAGRIADSRRRRTGAAKLTAKDRQKVHRIATQPRLGPMPVAAVRTMQPYCPMPLVFAKFENFLKWRRDIACASERSVAQVRNLAEAATLLQKVEVSKQLWVCLCFWRIDCAGTWAQIEEFVLEEKWSEVVRKLSLLQRNKGSMQSTAHQTYVDPTINVPGPEQHAMFMRHWRVTLLRFGGPAPAGLTTDEIARFVSRLRGVGMYMSKNIELTYLRLGLARDTVGTCGPGAHRACYMLLGITPSHTQQGLWPWSHDPHNVYGVVRDVSRRVRCTWRDAQLALCCWWRWQSRPEACASESRAQKRRRAAGGAGSRAQKLTPASSAPRSAQKRRR